MVSNCKKYVNIHNSKLWAVSYFGFVDENKADLRWILACNIKNARRRLSLSQKNLALAAGISMPYMTDIEYCRTWVSDKTLAALAAALNRRPYELLVPPETGAAEDGRSEAGLEALTEMIASQKRRLHAHTDAVLDSLAAEVIRAWGGAPVSA